MIKPTNKEKKVPFRLFLKEAMKESRLKVRRIMRERIYDHPTQGGEEMNIKIVTITVEEAPNNYVRPWIDMAKYPAIKVASLSELDVVPEELSTNTKETYPLLSFAYGKHHEEFYIRDKDKKTFED